MIRLPEYSNLGGLTRWLTGEDYINYKNCFAINFGWPQQLSMPQTETNIEDDEVFDAEIVRRNAPNNCFMVFVGGKYQKFLDDVVRKVDIIAKELSIKFTIYFAEKTNQAPEFNYPDKFLVIKYKNYL